MTNTSARSVLPSLQSLAFPSSDRSRANGSSTHDAGIVEFSKLLQKALGAPEAARDIDDTPPEREAISIETLSVAQGFTALDRPASSDSLRSDATIAPQAPGEGIQSGEDANRSCGGRAGEHRGDGDPSASPTDPMTPPTAPASSAQSSTTGGSEPSAPTNSMAGEARPNSVPSTTNTPSAAPALPAIPAATPGQLQTSDGVAGAERSNTTRIQSADFDALLATAAEGTSPITHSAPQAVAPAATNVPNVSTARPPAATAAAAQSVGPENPATPSPNIEIPTATPSGVDLSSNATNEAKAGIPATTAAAAQTPTPAATIAVAATPTTASPIASRNSTAATRAIAPETVAASAGTAEAALATTGNPRTLLAPEATEPSLRGTPHPPAALTAQLTQDASPIPVAAPAAPSTPNAPPIPIPIPVNAALTDEALDVPVIATEGIDASTPSPEPTGREAMIAANASPTSAEQTVARAQRAAMHPAVAQVAVSVTKAVQEGVDRITIKLQPPELGRIDVRIDVGVDGRIQAVFAAERPATMEILQRDVRELERALQNAGLSADSGSLSFGLKQQGGGRYSPFAGAMGPDAGAADLDVTGDTLVARNAAARRADGHLDIHV